jgi:hypothetical protein
MAHDRIDPSAEIPQADLLEQQTPLDPQLTLIHTPPTDPPAQPVDAASTATRVPSGSTATRCRS